MTKSTRSEYQSLVQQQLALLGFKCSGDEGKRDTPRRVTLMMDEFLHHAEPLRLTTFPANGYDQMIVERGLPFYSLCEHHIIPFFGTATIAYLPGERIVGISKLARVLDYYARRLTTQEYMTEQIARYINEELKPAGVGIIIRARHLCQEMRGIQKNGETVTSALYGAMRTDEKARYELIQLEAR